MKSRISIEVDFGNQNLPVIQIAHQNSDDVRDKLVSSFLQSLQHTSRWCTIEYVNMSDTTSYWKITPMPVDKIREEIKLMESLLQHKGE